MLWAEDMVKMTSADSQDRSTQVTLVAGRLDGAAALAPAPDSWAADPNNDVAIWIIEMQAGARWTLPAASAQPVNRTLYFFQGTGLQAAGLTIPDYHAVDLLADQAIPLAAEDGPVRMLLLQGRPIAEPVMQYGPFVMNTQAEIRQAFEDYRRTQFGGWPWQRHDPIHPGSRRRFARYADGVEEVKD